MNRSANNKARSWLRSIPRKLGWTGTSYIMMSSFIALIALIMYVWWPLVVEYIATYNPKIPFWYQFDLLLFGIFLVMSLLIMANADFKQDLPIVIIGFIGGLVIESWGTQTDLWTYYTNERPPLWIIPAWPIASLSIDRLYRFIRHLTSSYSDKVFTYLHWLIMPAFFGLLISYVWVTRDKSLTIAALLLSGLIILFPIDHRGTVLTFLAGSALGYYLELWGTTRLCWTYYTLDTPPVFAVFAHGMAAVAFWRVLILYENIRTRISTRIRAPTH